MDMVGLMNNNYILITIDALRADHLNIYGYEKRVTSPAIDQFAKQSKIYLNAYACGVPTFLSFPSIFCSIYPSKVMHNMYLPKNIPTFVELLKSKGFQTAAFIDNNPFCSSLLGYDRGFDLVEDYFVKSLGIKEKNNVNFVRTISKVAHFIDKHLLSKFVSITIPETVLFVKYLISTKLAQPKTNTEQMIQSAIEFMKLQEGNFFVWLHFMDIHSPYSLSNYRNPVMKYKVIKARRVASPIPNVEHTEEAIQLMEEMYDNNIRRLDAKLEIFFDFLQKGGILDNTNVFITSDHGEELLTRGLFLTHHENVYKEVAQVPLIIKKPNPEELLKSRRIISLLDIPTTILKNEKIPVPNEYEGVSIFQGKRKYAISETVVPRVNKLANNRKDLYTVQFNSFIYSIRDERYTIVYDRDNKYKFFDRNDDVLEKKKIKVPNNNLNDLLSFLKEHQTKKHVHFFGTEKERIKWRLRKLKCSW